MVTISTPNICLILRRLQSKADFSWLSCQKLCIYWHSFDQFMWISGSAWTALSGTLTEQRKLAAGLVIKGTNPDDADRLWLLGGFFGDSDKTSEFVFSNGTIVLGPYPYGSTGTRGVCMVQLDTGDVLILGGISTLKKVTLYNPTTGTFTTQQEMNFDKKEFACTVFYSKNHGKCIFYLKVYCRFISKIMFIF